jgi:hypothetical protein
MIAIGHSSTGVLVGVAAVAVAGPAVPWWLVAAIALVVAVVLHYACDFIPHGHYYINSRHLTARSLATLGFDFIGGVVLFLALAWHKFGLSGELLVITAAMFGALVPDMFESLIKLKIIPKSSVVKREMAFHGAMHWHDEPTSPLPHGARPLCWTDVWQLAVFVLAICALLWQLIIGRGVASV